MSDGGHMEENKSHSRNKLPADYAEILYRRHLQGAIVRSVASVFMWLFALAAYLANIIKLNHFTGISLSVLFLVLINPPTLLLLKHITNMRLYKYGSLLINFLEILGYTALIYFLGGIEATFLTPIYAALITYVGVLAPRSYTYTVAFMCSAAFSFVVISEYFGLLPNQSAYPFFNPSLMFRLTNLASTIGLLVVVAYISSLTSGTLKKNRDRLHEKNVELMKKTASLEEADREKEILLGEVHHRVKNNMQVISGLLDLQASSSENPELIAMFHESQSRIQAMSLVHEKLYGSKDFTRIDLADYVRTLSKELLQSYKINQGKIDLIVQADGEVYVDINKAIPCGLILNELISNALKHAFPGDRPCELRIIIHETKNTEIEIVVRDNGLGLPDDVDIHQPRTVGLHLVNGLVEKQLDGQIEVRRDNGTEFQIKFPL